MWQKRFPQASLQNADTVDSCGLYLPNNHQITKEEIKKICNIINEVLGD
jgi:dTDP-4-amino-4,6-dideoxygalactose transaminase